MRNAIGLALMSAAMLLPCDGATYPVVLGQAQARKKSTAPAISRDEIERAVRTSFGPKVQVTDSEPSYLEGDFNGDGHRDIAVQVNIENALTDLAYDGVSFINVDPYSKANGSKIDPLQMSVHNCVGVAIIHGTTSGWTTSGSDRRFLFYECFSGFKLIPRLQRIRSRGTARGAPPVLRGDAIQLELETGGRNIVYWDGRTYRGYAQRIGD